MTKVTDDERRRKIFTPGPRHQSDIDFLRREAEMKRDGHAIDNPARPYDADDRERAAEKLMAEGIAPAWMNDDELPDDFDPDGTGDDDGTKNDDD